MSSKSCITQCHRYYKKSGNINITSYIVDNSGNRKNEDVVSTFVPQHLEIIMTELIKNALKATVENATTDEIPDIEILGVKCGKHITIRISDKGGGASLAEQAKYVITLHVPYIEEFFR